MNRRLRHCHAHLLDVVVHLMGVDLLRQQAKWKDALGEMRTVVNGLVQEVSCGPRKRLLVNE